MLLCIPQSLHFLNGHYNSLVVRINEDSPMFTFSTISINISTKVIILTVLLNTAVAALRQLHVLCSVKLRAMHFFSGLCLDPQETSFYIDLHSVASQQDNYFILLIFGRKKTFAGSSKKWKRPCSFSPLFSH